MSFTGKKILLVEDEKILAKAQAIQLHGHGFDMAIASTGPEAIESVQGDPGIGLVLMDIDLGKGMDGTEAAAEILKIRRLPVVFLTSHQRKEIVERAKKITRYGYVLKTSGEYVIVSAIETAFELFEAQEALRKSEEKYRRIVTTANEGIFMLDRDMRFTYVNSKVLELLGYSEHEMLGEPAALVVAPEDRENHDRQTEERKQGKSSVYERHLRRKDGCIISTLVSASPVTGDAGTFEGSLGMIIDITDRIRAEEALREKEHFIEKILVAIPSFIYIYDLVTHRYTYVNHESPDFPGYSPEKTHGPGPESFPTILHPDDAASLTRHYGRFEHAREGEVRELEYRLKHSSGEWRWLRSRDLLFSRTPEGSAWQILGSAEDITEQRLAEKKVKKGRDYLENLINAIPDGLSVHDHQGVITMVNPMLCQMTGFTKEELLGSAPPRPYWPPEAQPAIDAAFKETLQCIPGSYELTFMRKNGERFPVLVSPSRLIDDEGSVISYFAIIKDISELKKAEEQLKISLKEKELLLNEIHHRVKNNLQIVSSLLALQQRKFKDPQLQQAFQGSRDRIQSIARLHENLYLRGNLAHLEFTSYMQSLVEFLSRVYGRPDITFDIRAQDIHLDIDRAIPIGLAANEIITNALKHAFPGGQPGMVVIELAAHEQKALTLTIRDNGIGLPPRIEIEKASSLGMQLIRRLVEQIQGTLEIARESGTAFIIRFQEE